MTEHHFKKGDKVPTWVQRIAPTYLQDRLVFGVDVLAEAHEGSTVLYPEGEPEGEWCLIYCPDAGGEKVLLRGAPTIMFAHPRGDSRNEHKPIELSSGAASSKE